jgi:hypothetical protein
MSRFFISLFAYSREFDNRDRESMAEQRAVEKDATLFCMNNRRKKAVRRIIFGIGLLIIALALYWHGNRAPEVADFTECAERGFLVMESYPRQCKTPDGETFREDIGNELEKDDLIRISEPRPNAVTTSPLTVKGVARGNWFLEASFPVRLFDENGELIARGTAQARAPWMTEEFVPFETALTFAQPTTETGTLLLERDNPSGLPENEDALRVPVRFR